LARSFLDRKARLAGLEFDRTLSPEDGAEALVAQVEAQLKDMEAFKPRAKAEGRKAEKRLAQQIQAAQDLIAQITDIADKNTRLKEAGYVPLMRFGNYGVYVTETDAEGNTEQIFFGMYQTQREANQAARALAEEYPRADIEQSPVSKQSYRLYAGISPETLALFAEHADLSKDPVFQKYLQLAVSNRAALKRLIKRKGVPGFSRDVPRTLAHFIISNARLSAQNYHFGPIKSHIDTLKGDVRDEAQKLFDYLAEPNEEAAGMRAYLFFHFLGGSVASAFVNATQPLSTTLPYLAQFGGAALAGSELLRAGHEAARNAPGADVAEAYLRAQQDGIIAPQEIYQLMAEARGSGTGAAYRLNRAWGMFFGLAEQFNRRTTFIAAYRIALARGQADPYAFAKEAVDETQFVYSKANRPNWARGPVGSVVFTFKQFSISYLEFLKRLPRGSQVLALGILIAAAGLEGLPFVDDLDDLIDTLGQWLGFATNTQRARQRIAAQILGQNATPYVLRGFSAGLPFDLSGRLGFGNLVPGTAALKPSETHRLREAAEALGPAGGLVESVLKGVDRGASGDMAGAAKLVVPNAARAAMEGMSQWVTGQVSDQQGRLIGPATKAEAFFKTLGFASSRQKAESKKQEAEYRDIELQRRTEDRFAEAITRAALAKDAAAAIVGGMLTRSLPQIILRDSNRGLVGYLANGASAFIISAASERVVKGSGGPALIGGMVMTVGRIAEDIFSRKLVEFGSLSD
ncbi:MAG: PLxRFG domain-containing protein, partial [Gammaproteobacteria bacterium]